jgi:hypothetical protein
LVIKAPVVVASPGTSGSFDVLLINPAGGASFNVAADSLGLSVSGPLDVTFTDVSINTVVAPYIYVTSGTTVGGGPLSLDTFPNTQFTASDSEFASPGFRTVNPGDTFGLAHVSFTVSPTSPLGTDVISFNPLATSLTDDSGNAITASLVNGAIGTSIPEPASLVEAATAALLGAAAFWWRKKRRRGSARYGTARE